MQIKDVQLSIGAENAAGTRQATVSYKLAFTAGEVGNLHRVAITLRGEDLPGDDETASQGPRNPLHTFRFGALNAPYTTVTAAAGETPYTWTRSVASDKLDEDPRSTTIQVDINTTLMLPHGDEIYAQVVAYNEARSTTVKFPLGV